MTFLPPISVGSAAPNMAGTSNSAATAIDSYSGPAREISLNDFGGPIQIDPFSDPDNEENLVRNLLYSNEIDLQGIISTTSIWKKKLNGYSTSAPMHIINAYCEVRSNLAAHDPAYPSCAHVRSLFALGQPNFGLAGIGRGQPLSQGAKMIIARADERDPRPLWLAIGGGANTLAEALWWVKKSRTPAEVAAFVRKLRVYSISDQDDTDAWIRREFPQLLWVGTPGSNYSTATWSGLSGEAFYRPTTVNQGPNSSLVTLQWLRVNIQDKGPLGAAYPTPFAIAEGDTAAWLNLVSNGLDAASNPTWGGWGGRYVFCQPPGEPRPFFTQCSGSADTVVGFDGQLHTDDFATIYRWRQAYQDDFADRMDWTLSANVADANYPPTVRVNGVGGTGVIYVSVRPGTPVHLLARATDRAKGHLVYAWFWYPEAGRNEIASSPPVRLSSATGQRTTVTALKLGNGEAHVILAVTNTGKGLPETSYRRVVLLVRQNGADQPAISSRP
ncbi:MAG: nucleoside hydrolase-like domain-containing protein [Acidimicrobiales bacterium]